MAGEAQHTYTAIPDLDAESKPQNEGGTTDQLSEKTAKESSEPFPSTGTEAPGRRAKFVEKERDYTQQREAVIRPQQTGKIDFKSLQNRPKFSSDRTWPGGKGNPQSPNGKSRNREKGKRAGKTERGNPQQLYRLSITNPRSNPTIGIAYPQQKVSPPKKLEAGRGPITGSYRFHVPSIPEREAELQQEELSYSRCFQEGSSSNLTSPGYTSHSLGAAGGAPSHQHPPQTQAQSQLQQQPGHMENSTTQPGSQLLFPDFPLSVSNTWQSPERPFNNANYGISSHKSSAPAEGSKASTGFVPLSFQYGYQLLEDSTPDPFPCDQNPQSQDFMDSTLGSGQVAHTSFSYQASGESQEGIHNNDPFGNEQSEDRSTYPHPPQPAQYLQTPPGAASSMHCPRGGSEDSASSESSGSSFQPSEQSVPPERSEAYGQASNRDVALAPGSQRSCHAKDTPIASQRTVIQGSGHHARTIARGPSSQMHFSNKPFSSPPLNNVHMGEVTFDQSIKVHGRQGHTWERLNKAYSTEEQNSLPYANMNDKFQFQNQAALDPRPKASKDSRNAWQQIHLTPAVPNQNRIELTGQLSNPKSTYLVSPSDWHDDSKTQKNGSLKSPGLFKKRTGDTFSNPRQESVKQSCNTISSFKVETSHAQVCDSKNKPVFFGLNQSLAAASSARAYGYSPLQVPPMGLMMVSPYESPLPSPVHNPAPSSTCSSLSPASTSPVNLSSEESQMSMGQGPPPPFYHQHQVKAQVPSDLHNTHHFHPDTSRNLPYAPERAKDDMMSYLHSNGPPKPAMEGSKGYMEGFGVEHQPPPPPYSAHQLLATSLATANLDQLDVLLTCKQCDQNFNNLASFLGHKQYCGQHAFGPNDFKEVSKMEDSRKFHTDVNKASSSRGGLCENVPIPRCPSDLHLSLLGLNRNGELMTDSEAKVDSKEDPMKLSLFSGPGTIPVPLPDLEMEDAKLDSLITEALNGLGYQSDNAEIDSSFIDAFADDDLTTVKVMSNRQSVKSKESIVIESKSKQITEDDRSLTQGKYIYDSEAESLETYIKHTETKLEKTSLNLEQSEKINIKKEISHKNSRNASGERSREHDSKVKEARKLCKSEDEIGNTSRFLLSSKYSERCGVKRLQEASFLTGAASSQSSTGNRSSPMQRAAARESKRKRTGGGTWSKELIHKIVQQKNKLHKLHVKGTKNLQFSLVMERLTPACQNPAFGEYDYVSDSDDEREPVKIASQGRLSQSSRCKYTYTKECKWRARSERDQAAWRHESRECFEVKKSEDISLSSEKHDAHQRLRRRSSRSSSSSELSTSVSISSDSIGSPKSTDRTDSDCEKKVDFRRRDSPKQKTYERSPHKLCKESSTQLALTFITSTKKYGGDKMNPSLNQDLSETIKSHQSHFDDVDSGSVLPKTRGAVKNHDKCKIPDTSTGEKDVSESSTAFASDQHTPLRADVMTSKLESTHLESTSTDRKPNQLESCPAAIHKESEPHYKNEMTTKGTSGHGRESGGPQTTQQKAKLSDTTTFEKCSDGPYAMKEQATLTSDLVPKSTSLCSGLMDDMCLSPAELHVPLTQKDTSHLIPYPLEQDQTLIKSPLSFDTSSMFGDLTVPGFENGLYTDLPLHKVSFNSLESANDKKEVYPSSYSPFLVQRDWGLMVDVSPMLPDEISDYKDESEKSNEKKSDYGHIPLSLPDKIMAYNGNLSGCVSEDELEIKRIVTELESQLQTTKLRSPTALSEEAPNHLKMSKFSPLRLGEDPESEEQASCPVQSMPMGVSTIQSDTFAEPGLPWSSPFHFELMEGQHSPQTPNHTDPGVQERLTEKEDDERDSSLIPLHSDTDCQTKRRQTPEGNEEGHRDTSEEILERKMYAENLMKSLEVISDSVFKKDPISSKQKQIVLPRESREQVSECQTPAKCEDEKEALSPAKVNIEFLLNESQQPLPANTSDINTPLSLLQSESVENDESLSKVISTVKHNQGSEAVCCLDEKMVHSQVAEQTSENLYEEDREQGNPEDRTEYSDHSELQYINNHKELEEAVEGLSRISREPSVDSMEEGPQTSEPEGFTYEDSRLVDTHTDKAGCGLASADGVTEIDPVGVKDQDLTEEDEHKQEGLIDHAAFQSCSETGPQTNHISMEIVTDAPCSPLLEPSAEHVSQRSPPFLSQPIGGEALNEQEAVLTVDVFAPVTFGDDPETHSRCGSVEKQEEEGENAVEDYDAQLPIRLMASPQISAYIHAVEKELDQEEAPPAPAPTPSPPPASSPSFTDAFSSETPATQEDQCQSQSICPNIDINHDPIEDAQFPREDNGDELHTKGHKNELFSVPKGTAYSLSPTHLGRGDTEPPLSSPLPLCTTAEAPEILEDDQKSNAIYDFKLSPLNYGDKSDEPPELNQFNYTPVSPDNTLEEQQPDIKCSPKGDCGLYAPASHDMALIANRRQTDTEPTVCLERSAELTPAGETVDNNGGVQDCLKLTCIALGFPLQSNSPSASTGDIKEDLDMCHDPFEPNGFLHMHIDLLEKVEPEALSVQQGHCEAPPLNDSTSEGQLTPQTVLICDNESKRPPSSELRDKHPTEEAVQSLASQHPDEDTTQPHDASVQLTAPLGKVLCEMCSMCFRTVAGLKRHKAMKHLVRTDRNTHLENATLSHQRSMLTSQHPHTAETGHKDDSQISLQKEKVEIIANHCPETSENRLVAKQMETDSVLENAATETNMAKTGSQQRVQTKTKKNPKTCKSKNSEVQVKPDPFSDELLNILKTDILQAITPDFQTRVQQECRQSPKIQDDLSSHIKHSLVEPKEAPLSVAVDRPFEDLSKCQPEEADLARQNADVNPNIADSEVKCGPPDITNGAPESGTDVSKGYVVFISRNGSAQYDVSKKNFADAKATGDRQGACESLAREIMGEVALEIKCERNSRPTDDNPLSYLKSPRDSPPGLSPDLKAFLDDESSFSQLFPRDEDTKRKKCARVYGKKTQKQTPFPESPLPPEYPPGDVFLENKEQHPNDQMNEPFESVSCAAEVPPTSCPLPILASSSPYPEQPCVTDSLPPLPSIDMQSTRTTFQLPEIQLFDSSKDPLVSGPLDTDDTETKRADKTKKPTERKGRKRQDGSGLKIKDKQYKCKVCFTWFLTLGELNFHKLSHNPSPPPTCYMCVQRKFSSREQLRDHLREKHAKNKAGIWTCGMCLKEISDVWMYNEHLREHATQFAHKGQTQSSILGMAGGIMQETAVKNFITSIMQRRPSKASREASKSSNKDQVKATPETGGPELKAAVPAEPKVPKNKSTRGEGGRSKQSNLTPMEVLHKTDTAPKNVEMHPNCKDPSRDCHHCGKQFPKPFKLQRHLVVHNLEKIFLCHKCPVSYQEPQDLKDHLKNEHEVVDEADSKHTTLYTCELCADVMHVIKKSFICSTCNYTFSKKEQFDRHMEKHLSGGNKIFKFRGVLRPLKVSTSKENESEMPSVKKRKIQTENLQENSPDSGISSIASILLNQSSEMPPMKHAMPTTEDSTQTSATEYHAGANDASVKTEDVAEDYSALPGERERHAYTAASDPAALSTATPKAEDANPNPSGKLAGEETCEVQLAPEPCEVKEEEEPLGVLEEAPPQWPMPRESVKHGEEGDGSVRERRDSVEGGLPSCAGESAERKSERRESATEEPNEELYVSVLESLLKTSHKTPDLQLGPRQSLAVVMDRLSEDEQGHMTKANENKQRELPLPRAYEQLCGGSLGRDRASPAKPSDSTRNGSNTSPKSTEATPVLHPRLASQGPTTSEDRESVRQQKKRKEIRSPHGQQRVSSPATRENLSLDARPKKKFRPNKCESPAVHRRSDSPSDYPVLSSVRDDVVSNKIVSQQKTLGLKLKRAPLDICTPKKMEIAHHLNGDYRVKKGPVGRPLHSPVSKVSTPPLNNSLNKSRPKSGVRSVDSQSYRTAESQNNLLSQLFGQKLTSFKIPLRKDT
ncbi:zinc finger protein 469 isoform X1 [Hypomesus transpacificus]|uniref:zinc finger protein 469 isoform X1 n=1 Tax=Hypomesus transpacificus TaxID=137520 RepID=UPI001F088305|nr:zinc finger protein 469 isoform X1 [Hypomesus transpacificus]